MIWIVMDSPVKVRTSTQSDNGNESSWKEKWKWLLEVVADYGPILLLRSIQEELYRALVIVDMSRLISLVHELYVPFKQPSSSFINQNGFWRQYADAVTVEADFKPEFCMKSWTKRCSAQTAFLGVREAAGRNQVGQKADLVSDRLKKDSISGMKIERMNAFLRDESWWIIWNLFTLQWGQFISIIMNWESLRSGSVKIDYFWTKWFQFFVFSCNRCATETVY